MFEIDTDKNAISALEKDIFRIELERALQPSRMDCKKPNCLGEELLIIKKEFVTLMKLERGLTFLHLIKMAHW